MTLKEVDLGHLFDIEVLPDIFMLGVEEWLTKDQKCFHISKFRDQRYEIYEFLDTVQGFWCGFNSVSYDDIVLTYFYKDFGRLRTLSASELCKDLRWFSDQLIRHQNDGTDASWKIIKDYYYIWTKSVTQLDPFRYWSKMLRLSKQLSLKALGVQLRWPETQELPFDGSFELSESQIEELEYYNMKNDLGRLRQILYATENDFFFRKDILENKGLNCYTYDGPKIAQVLIKQNLEKLSGDNTICEYKEDGIRTVRQTIRDIVPIKDVLFDYSFDGEYKEPLVRLETVDKKIGKKTIKVKREVRTYKNLYSLCKEWSEKEVEDTSSLAAECYINNPDGSTLMLVFGSGGIHGVTERKSFDTKKGNFSLLDFDFASYYPNLMLKGGFVPEHLGDLFKQYFETIVRDRIAAKKTGDKITAEILKLLANSTYGMLNNDYSYMKDIKAMLGICINGQLIISNFIEKCVKKGYSVIYANTDGFSIKVEGGEKERLEAEQFVLGLNTWGIELESFQFEKWWMRDVNNYIVKKTDGSVKDKGVFLLKPKLGDNTNEMVFRKAVVEYFLHQTPVRTFIENHKDIWDFCRCDRVSKKYDVFFGGKPAQNLNLYYVSKKGAYLQKKKKTNKSSLLSKDMLFYDNNLDDERFDSGELFKGTGENIKKGYALKLMNLYDPSVKFEDRDVNLGYYIRVAQDIIGEFENEKLTDCLYFDNL